MMKISFEIIRHHCLVLATTGNLHTYVCFYVNIRLNKDKYCRTKLVDRFRILEEIKIYKVRGKKLFNQMAAKAKNVELTEAFIEAYSGVFRTQTNM